MLFVAGLHRALLVSGAALIAAAVLIASPLARSRAAPGLPGREADR